MRRRREGMERCPRQDLRAALHELLEVEAGPPRQDLEGTTEAHLVVLPDETDDVAAGAAPEAVEESPTRGDGEGRRPLLVERTPPHQHPSLLLELDPPLSDDRVQLVRGLDPLDPFLADLHLSSPLLGGPQRPGLSVAELGA